MPIEIICEAGISHEGSLDKAKLLVDTVKAIGAKIVKFQTFQPNVLLRPTDPAKPILEKVALTFKEFAELSKHCERTEIEFMSTPGDVDSLKFLVNECGIKRIKIGSDDLTYKPLTDAAYSTGLPVILSTGMATLDEIQRALPDKPVNLTLLHCVSLYPTPAHLVNLKAMDALKALGWPVGYSDHTDHIAACVAAAARGAVIIEKHFKLAGYKGMDAEVSASPGTLRNLLIAVATIETMLGDGDKTPSPEEKTNRLLFRKGLDGYRGMDWSSPQ